MAKARLRLVTATIVNRTVTPKRRPNKDLRTREHLTEAEVERLIKALIVALSGHTGVIPSGFIPRLKAPRLGPFSLQYRAASAVPTAWRCWRRGAVQAAPTKGLRFRRGRGTEAEPRSCEPLFRGNSAWMDRILQQTH